jgi:hypothetical protein
MRCAREPLRGTPHRAALRSADTERLAHLAETEARLLVLLAERLLAVRLLRLLAEPTAPLLLALLTLLTLLEQRQHRGRQRLLHGLLHRVPDTRGQRAVQRESQVRVRMLGDPLLLELLLDLLDLLERLLHLLRDLLGRLLARLLDGLLDQLGDLLRAAGLRARLLQGLGTGHHRHECNRTCGSCQRPRNRSAGQHPDTWKLRTCVSAITPHGLTTMASRSPAEASGGTNRLLSDLDPGQPPQLVDFEATHA